MEDVVIVVMIANGIKRAFVKSIPLMSLKKRSYTIISMKLKPNFCRLFAIIASLFCVQCTQRTKAKELR